MEALDFLGNELKVGDKVIYTELRYRHFQIAYIMKITPQMLQLDKSNSQDKSRWFKQEHGQVIKYE